MATHGDNKTFKKAGDLPFPNYNYMAEDLPKITNGYGCAIMLSGTKINLLYESK